MFEQINSGFIKGETYYVKIKKYHFSCFIAGDLLFDNYNCSKTGVWFRDISGHYEYFELNEINIYRYVSEEEFLKKRKEKYDLNCLNSVLKRLLDESFVWS